MKYLKFIMGLVVMVTSLTLSSALHAEIISAHSFGLTAYAYASDEVYDGDMQTGTSIDVFWEESEQRTGRGATDAYSNSHIYYNAYTWNGLEEIGCNGFANATDWSLDRLESATASATLTLSCYKINSETGEYVELEPREINVYVSLEGIGSVTRGRDSYNFVDPPNYHSTYSHNGRSREAVPMFFIDGLSFAPSSGGSIYGELDEGRSNITYKYVP